MLTKKILTYIKKEKLCRAGDRICVGLSGGADSVSLLLILLELQEELQIQISAVHVDHQLRGAESDGDCSFVETLCKERGVPLYIVRRPVAELVVTWGMSIEEAGRRVRQEAFRAVMQEHGVTKIALAHHMNDLAETMLFRAARGTSLHGAAGMHARDEWRIRPLLAVTREEIEAYLRERQISWRTDSTNETDEYTRNGIRHRVIPYLEGHVNAETVRHMAMLSEDLAEADALLEELAADWEQRAVCYVRKQEAMSGAETKNIVFTSQDSYPGKKNDIVQGAVLADALLDCPRLLRGYVIRRVLEKVSGSARDWGRSQIDALQELLEGRTGRRVDLPYGLWAVRDVDGVRLLRTEEKFGSGEPCVDGVHIRMPEDLQRKPLRCEQWQIEQPEGDFDWENLHISGRLFELEDKELLQKIPSNRYTKWFDYDKIKSNLCLRTREAGDFIVVNDKRDRQSIKKYMINEKIPQRMRDRMPLLACGSEVLWVIGHRIGWTAKVTEETRRVWEVQVTGGTKNE